MSSNPNPGLDSKPRRIREMFASIVPRYDLVNSLMTMGLDHRWRRETVAAVTPKAGLALDIATGTGELAFELVRQGARLVVAADFCPEMLVAATKKPAFMDFKDKITLVAGDTLALPFADGTFDGIVNGFMLRNVADLPATFVELCRVLKPGGSLACLDLTPPRGPMRHFFGAYIAVFVPLLGITVARNYGAYRYLFQSLSIHPDADQIRAMMCAAGFEASYQLTGFGTVAIHLGHKPKIAARREDNAL